MYIAVKSYHLNRRRKKDRPVIHTILEAVQYSQHALHVMASHGSALYQQAAESVYK